jgi:hypothetical protein
MAESVTLLALFDDIEPASKGIAKLKALGVADGAMNVVSGLPFPSRVLGRPGALTYVSKIALLGAILGAGLGIFLLYGTAFLYPLYVGGQPIYPVPMGFIAVFETAMLGLMSFAFLGLFVDSGFPTFTPKDYVPEISDGKIAVFFECEGSDQSRFVESLTSVGAESVQVAEKRQL